MTQSKLKGKYYLSDGKECACFVVYRDGTLKVRNYFTLGSSLRWDKEVIVKGDKEIERARGYYRAKKREGWLRKTRVEIFGKYKDMK
jgi:hypothetical protein